MTGHSGRSLRITPSGNLTKPCGGLWIKFHLLTLALQGWHSGPRLPLGPHLDLPTLCLAPTLFQLQRPKVPQSLHSSCPRAFAQPFLMPAVPSPDLIVGFLPVKSQSCGPFPEQPSLTPTDRWIQASEAKLVSLNPEAVCFFVFFFFCLFLVVFLLFTVWNLACWLCHLLALCYYTLTSKSLQFSVLSSEKGGYNTTLERLIVGSPGTSVVKNPPASAGGVGDTGSIPGSGRSPEEEMATHSSILAWRIPGSQETGGLQSLRLQTVDMTEHTYKELSCG